MTVDLRGAAYAASRIISIHSTLAKKDCGTRADPRLLGCANRTPPTLGFRPETKCCRFNGWSLGECGL